jgi:hypothetical protein
MSYQGFENWETWHTMLVIENDKKLYHKAQFLLKNNNLTQTQFRKGLLSAERITRKLFRQNLRSGRNLEPEEKKWHRVNWSEIFKHSVEYLKGGNE